MQLSVQGYSPTFNIGNLPFEMVAAIQDRLLFVQDGWLLLSRRALFVWDIWLFFEIRPAIRDGVLFVRDGNCLFKIGNFCSSWKIVVIYNYPPIPTILYVLMTHILTVVEPHTTTGHSYSLTQNESKAATSKLKYLTINLWMCTWKHAHCAGI